MESLESSSMVLCKVLKNCDVKANRGSRKPTNRVEKQCPLMNHLNANTARSNGTLGVSQANQSDLVVLESVSQASSPRIALGHQEAYGNSPIPLTFHIPKLSATKFIST